MSERRFVTSVKVAALIQTHKDDPNAHHVPDGGADIKSGTVSGASGSVTFNTPFSSVPQVVMTSLGNAPTRDAILRVDSVSATGFSWTADISQDAAWIATDAGDS